MDYPKRKNWNIKMAPVPDVEKLGKLPFTPLPRYKAQKFPRKGSSIKNKPSQASSENAYNESTASDEEENSVSEEESIALLRECARKIKVSPLPTTLERKIMSCIPTHLLKSFPVLTKQLFSECQIEWDDVLRNLAVKSVIKEMPGVPRKSSFNQKVYFEDQDITEKHNEIKKIKKKLQNEALVLHPFIRRIIEKSEITFPTVIIDLSKYGENGSMSLEDFESKVLDEIKRVDYLVSSSWYNNLVKSLKNGKYKDKLHKNLLPKFVKLTIKLISIQIQELMRRSIDHFIEYLGSPMLSPLLHLKLNFNEEFYYSPTLETVSEVFHNIIDNMSHIAQRMMPIEHYLDLPYNHDVLAVRYNDWLKLNGHDKLQKQIHCIFQPLRVYLNNLADNFSMLHGQSAEKNLHNFIDNMEKFEDGSNKIMYFRQIDSNITGILQNEYFTVAVVCQINMISNLKKRALHFIDEVINCIVEKHMSENIHLCSEFEHIKSMALKQPKNAEELVEQGNFMANAKTVVIETLKTRVARQINILLKLVEIIPLSPKHLAYNSQILNWLTEIDSIFQKHTVAFELYKSEMEDNLINKISVINNKVDQITPHLKMLDQMDDINNTLEYLEYLRKLILQLDKFDKFVEFINIEEKVLKMPPSVYSDFEEVKDYIKTFHCLVYLVHQWRRCYFRWMDGVFEYIDHNEVERQYSYYNKEFDHIYKVYKNKIKQQVSDGIEKRFAGLVDDPDYNNQPAPMKLCAQAIAEIKAWKPNVQMTHIMCNPALRQRHWDEMSEILGFDLTPNAGTTLRKIINFDLWNKLDQYEIISVVATNELHLYNNFIEMKNEWKDVSFETTRSKCNNLNLLCETDDIQSLLNEHVIRTTNMRGSGFSKPFRKEINEWLDVLTRIEATIDQWVKIQSQLLYFFPIFNLKSMASQMTESKSLFLKTLDIYDNFLIAIQKDSKVVQVISNLNTVENFVLSLKYLDEVNDLVKMFLENKRARFPRFYFLSNNVLLNILSDKIQFSKLQAHLNSFFAGIDRIVFDKNSCVSGIMSKEGEIINFTEAISISSSSIDNWLIQVEQQMFFSLKKEIKLALSDHLIKKRNVWIFDWAGMAVLVVTQLLWTQRLQEILITSDKTAMIEFSHHLKDRLEETLYLVKEKDLSKANMVKIETQITFDLYHKELVLKLINNNVQDHNDFSWLSQLRYYWNEDCISVTVMNSSMLYRYEYLGNTYRLIMTPFTLRCYHTIINAYYLHLNGAINGMDGSGKSAMINDLSKALAVFCVMFNCFEHLSYQVLQQYFKGAASCGVWLCFQQINKVHPEILSVLAQRISSLITAQRENVDTLKFEGINLAINSACYICITINTTHANDNTLPYNFKLLFRSISMISADNTLILEVLLYSYGFAEWKKAASKIVFVIQLSAELLLSKHHFDYGFKIFKRIVMYGHDLKKLYHQENELTLILTSIVNCITPSLTHEDTAVFHKIISDTFPGACILPFGGQNIVDKFRHICCTNHMQPTDSYLTKISNIYQTMLIRHGIIIIGDTFAGKSSALKILLESLNSMCEEKYTNGCIYRVLNPKIFRIGDLYGSFDSSSSDWKDGILTSYFRKCMRNDDGTRKWIILDGPIDNYWIESFSSVLSDRKVLNLISGEMLKASDSMSFIFEVTDLPHACPAIVSNCGVIYLESTLNILEPFIITWIKTLNSVWSHENEAYIKSICEWIIEPLLLYVLENCVQLVIVHKTSLLTTTLDIVKMTMDDVSTGEEENKHFRTWILASFMTALCWGIGGTLNYSSRQRFDEMLKQYIRGENGLPHNIERIEVSIPAEGMIIDHFYVYKGKGSWKHWSEAVKNSLIKDETYLLKTFIPTPETEKITYLLKFYTKYSKPLILVGHSGTGKSYNFHNFLSKVIDLNEYYPIVHTFSNSSEPNQIQKCIMTNLLKRKKYEYRAPTGKKAVVFIDDMNMPQKDKYGSQTAIEMVRFYHDYKFWHDINTGNKIHAGDILFFGAIRPQSSSSPLICSRMLRRYNVFAICDMSSDNLTRIFTSLLQIGWKKNGLGQDLQPIVVSIISATTELFEQCCLNFLPIPSKSHYIFNIRDFAKVIQGCALLRKDSVESKKTFARLWIHEVFREFSDRLVDATDRNWFYELLKQVLHTHMKEPLELLMDSYVNENGEVTENNIRKLMFGYYLNSDNIDSSRKYEEITNKETLLKVISSALFDYNSTHNTHLSVVFFDYALEQLSKIHRILNMPTGNAVLIGFIGSGRTSLTRLSSYMSGHNTYQPEINNHYTRDNFTEDIKNALKECGGFDKDVTLIFTNSQIKHFLSVIDSLLVTGEVPNLFDMDEKQNIIETVRLAAQYGDRNLDISSAQILSFFVNRCKIKLHIVLCLSPINNTIQATIAKHPSIMSLCTTIWFEGWSENALDMVAEFYIFPLKITDKIKRKSIVACKKIHQDMQSGIFKCKQSNKKYVTTLSYKHFLQLFSKLITEKQNKIKLAKLRFTNGLNKLNDAANAIEIMQKELNALKPQLVHMTENSIKMMKQVEIETGIVDKAAGQVRVDQKNANIQAAAAQELKKDCEADLAIALPILEEAVAALNTLKPADITIVKSMKNPPSTVKLVMASVCVMKGIPPDKIPDPNNPGKRMFDYWSPSKRLLGDMGFLESLKNYDKDNIPPSIMQKIRKEYITNCDFKPHIVAKASAAAEGLCKWIIAMDMYDAVAKVVAPKKAKLEAAEKEFADTMAILDEKKATLARLETQLAQLNSALEEANNKKQKLETEMQLCLNKLVRAEKLLHSLGDEKERWGHEQTRLNFEYENLAGDLLISCGIIAYLASYVHNARLEIVDKWIDFISSLNIPHSTSFSFENILCSGKTIQKWFEVRLPKDIFFVENAIIQKETMRYSLFIDPQGQAKTWIKNLEILNDLNVLKFTNDACLSIVENCVEYGRPVLLEYDHEDVSLSLIPILLNNTFLKDDKKVILVGTKIIELHSNFRLYMTTNIANLNFSVELFNYTTIINFELTKCCLDDYLLQLTITTERPDLQKSLETTKFKNASFAIALKKTENDILQTLQESKGDILEDEAAIQVVDSAKLVAAEINKNQKGTLETELQIENLCRSYVPLSNYVANYYFCLIRLANINSFYQFSLRWFNNLYILSIKRAKKSKDLATRIKHITETFLNELYINVSRSLFNKDKLLFSFMICVVILLTNKLISREEYMFLIRDRNGENFVYKSPISWFSDKCWSELCLLEEHFLPFKGLSNHLEENSSDWKKWRDDIDIHKNPEIDKFIENLNSFQLLLVVKVICPEKATKYVCLLIEQHLGKQFVIPPEFNISESFKHSNFFTPLILIYSGDEDPMNELRYFAKKMGYNNRLQSVAFGLAQETIAKTWIKKAQADGDWICLQNCHIDVKFLTEIDLMVENFNINNTDLNFRLWLTIEASIKYPQSIFQTALKITNESSLSLKYNICRSYLTYSNGITDAIDVHPGKEKEFSKLLYGLSFFHAVVRGRYSFGTIGWRNVYDFSSTDFNLSVCQFLVSLRDYDKINFDMMTCLITNCNYGGVITNEWDMRLLTSLFKSYFNEEVVANPYYLFSDKDSRYGLPRRSEQRDYIKFIACIPEITEPEVYGLHHNAGINHDYNNYINLMSSLRTIESVPAEISTIEPMKILTDILKRIPSSFDIELINKIDLSKYFNKVLHLELHKFNLLIKQILTTIKDIIACKEGFSLMSPDLEIQAQAILNNTIPQNWEKYSYLTSKQLSAYLTDLIDRVSFFDAWLKNGTPSSFWLTSFFSPRAFLTAIIADYANNENCSMEDYILDLQVQAPGNKTSPPDFGVYVHGLFLDGGRWDQHAEGIAEQHTKIMMDQMPAIWIYPVLKNLFQKRNRYNCPLYQLILSNTKYDFKQRKRNFVEAFYLPSDKLSDHWVKRNVALFLQADEGFRYEADIKY